MICIFLVVSALFTGVEGLYESIDDITNNLATDLAPLITLFGEQATKQFLSESTSILDSIIFSIAPLGLITAVVSVIRIYGSSSFKSIIGRSQEAHGVAEAELCSSTSRDVCELWSNGGICRVFGRPKILDFIYNTNAKNDFYPKYRKDQRQDIVEEEPSCGIYRANTLFVSNDEEMKKKMESLGWEEVSSNRWAWPKLLSRLFGNKPNGHRTEDEPSANPNLTLNIGIRKIHKSVQWSILVFSVLLQLSFFGYAAWATFYNPSFLNEGAPSPQAKVWFGLTILGTVMLVFGMILCARLIDLKSCERMFKRIRGRSEIFWLQPGGQRIGDQHFHAFAYSESRDEYITSGRVDNTKRGLTLLLAVVSTTSGWVLQFVGLRGSPGSIALFQFVATLIMSFLRAVLRGKRLEATNNRLGHDNYKRSNFIEGHELDWQAMNIEEVDRHYVTGWRVNDHVSNEKQDRVKKETHDGVTVVSTRRFRAYYTSNDDSITNAANYASDWIAAQEAISSDSPPSLASEEAQDASPSQGRQNDRACTTSINPAAKIMRFRSRLAKLTSVQFGLPAEQAWGGEIRTTALQLQKALQVSVEYIFAQFPLNQALESSFAPKAIAWESSCWFSKLPDRTTQEKDLPGVGQPRADDVFTIGFQMYNRDGKWSISSHQLEAVLGLWSWSLKQSELLLGPTAEENLIRSKMVVIEKSKRDDIEAALYRWVTQTRKVREYRAVGGISRANNLSIPTSSLLGRAQPSEQSSAANGQNYKPSTDIFTILGVPTNGSTSLLQLMAQDVYTVFINRIVDIVGDLRGTGDPEDYLTLRGHSLSTTSRATPLLELTNPHIDALANALVSAGVATREEALMSIVPAFLRQTKLPVLDEYMVQNLLDWAKSLRRELKFREGAALITWMLSSCPVRFCKLCFRCLGDLYRRAARSTKTSDQEFGLSGMRDMKKRYRALASDSQAQDILDCYEHLYAFFHDQKTQKTSKVEYEDSDALEVVENDLEDFEMALTLSERIYLRRQSVVSRILEWALVKDFPELIEDLWMSANLSQLRHEESPLLYALAWKCELETFHSLMDWPGMDVDAEVRESERGDHFRTPLICAIDANRADVVRSILRRGADAHRRDSCSGWEMTPLHHALLFSNMTTIHLLLDKGADIHERAARGQTALHLAAKANSEAVILFLLENGAEVNEKDDRGRTPLHHAAKANSKDVIQFLLENGAEVHEKDHRGQTPLHHAVTNRKGEEVSQLLLEKGAEIHETDNYGQTPLHCAAACWSNKVAHLLLENGAEIQGKDNNGRTALHLAAGNGTDDDITRLLLEKGADMYEENDEGRTAMHVAVQCGRQSVLWILRQRSAENGSVDDDVWSSLWYVIRKDDKAMARLLEKLDIEKPRDTGEDEEQEGKKNKRGCDQIRLEKIDRAN